MLFNSQEITTGPFREDEKEQRVRHTQSEEVIYVDEVSRRPGRSEACGRVLSSVSLYGDKEFP